MREVEYITINPPANIIKAGSGMICSAKLGAFQVDITYNGQETGLSVTLFARMTENGYYALTVLVVFGSDTPQWVMTNYGRTVAVIANIIRRKSDHFDDYRYTETAVMQNLRELRVSDDVVAEIKKLSQPSSPIRAVAQGKWK